MSLPAMVHGKQSYYIVSNSDTVVTERLYLCYGDTESFPDSGHTLLPLSHEDLILVHMGDHS